MKHNYLKLKAGGQHFLHQNKLWGVILLFIGFTIQAQAQVKEWDGTYGGNSLDNLTSMQQTNDGGYIVGGYSSSGASGDKSGYSRLGNDYWILKLDENGNKIWDKTYGGNQADALSVVIQTSDGGYLLGGSSLSGMSGEKSEPNHSSDYDFWVVKVDAQGNVQWDRTLGGVGSETLRALQQTSDGNYLIGGSSSSGASGDKSEALRGSTLGGADYWIIMLDARGNKLWDRSYGGEGGDFLQDLQQTNDGGFVLGGMSFSDASGDKSERSRGSDDYWIVKVDANGAIQWDKTYGAEGREVLSGLQQTTDGGYIIGGYSYSGSGGDKSEDSKGNIDYWVIKLNENGAMEWEKTIGGNMADELKAIQQTSDGGYILGGQSFSDISGDKSEENEVGMAYWIVKLDAGGVKLWDKSYSGDNGAEFMALQQTRDGGYILGGSSFSGIGGDKSEPSRGLSDYWVIKLSSEDGSLPVVSCHRMLFDEAEKGLISTINTSEGPVHVTGRKRNQDGSFAAENHAAVFDTQAPTGDDTDLYTTNWGRALIINRDLSDVPDDNEWGGELILDFSEIGPVTMQSLKALDIDEYEYNSWVYLYNEAGEEIYKEYLENLGNNSKQEVSLGNTRGVMKMRILLEGIHANGQFAGSGAIDDIRFCVEKEAATVDEITNEEALSISQAKVYPNPIEGRGTIEFKQRDAGNYVVNLYDMKGNLVNELKAGTAKAGEKVVVEVNSNQLYEGLYFARIVTESGTKTIKLIMKK